MRPEPALLLQFLWRAAGTHQLDHLATELRSVRGSRPRHRELLEHKCSGVHETGSTSLGTAQGRESDLQAVAVNEKAVEMSPGRAGESPELLALLPWVVLLRTCPATAPGWRGP